jgi:hypothetical protein
VWAQHPGWLFPCSEQLYQCSPVEGVNDRAKAMKPRNRSPQELTNHMVMTSTAHLGVSFRKNENGIEKPGPSENHVTWGVDDKPDNQKMCMGSI